MSGAGGSASAPGISVELTALIALRQEASRLHLAPRGQVLATRSGGHLSRFRGRGLEFDESRVYQAGDDPRNMDWRVTARRGVPHIKLFCEERERPVWLVTDLGPSMRFGTRVAFKSTIAARAAALLAWAAADKGDRVGGLVFDETRQVEQRPATRTKGVLPLLKALSGDPVASAGGGHADIGLAARHLGRLVRPGSLIYLISDFQRLGPGVIDDFSRLSQANELVLIRIFDPLEAVPPPRGRYPVTDGTQRGVLDLRGEANRAQWTQRFLEQTDLLTNVAVRHHAHLLQLCTDQPVGAALAQGLQPRPADRHRVGR